MENNFEEKFLMLLISIFFIFLFFHEIKKKDTPEPPKIPKIEEKFTIYRKVQKLAF
jgi:hypothetical protein